MDVLENDILDKEIYNVFVKIKEDWVISLDKNEIELILKNRTFFDDFIISLAEDFYENWDIHLESQKKIEWLTKEEISEIINNES